MIDGHVHVWTLNPERYPWQPTLAHVPVPVQPATVEHLLAEMDLAGVNQTVLVQPSVYGWDNAYLCDCLERFPQRFVGVCLVNPRSPEAGAALRHWCAERGCRGVRLNTIGEANAAWLLGTAPASLLEMAVALAVPVALQMQPRHAPVLGALAARHPDLTFVVDYLGAAAFHDGSGITAVETLAEHVNICFKVLSVGLDSHQPYPYRDLWPLYERAVETFGAGRLIFGTDFPHVRAACSYQQGIKWLDELPFLDEAARTAVADTNARRIWGFPAAP